MTCRRCWSLVAGAAAVRRRSRRPLRLTLAEAAASARRTPRRARRSCAPCERGRRGGRARGARPSGCPQRRRSRPATRAQSDVPELTLTLPGAGAAHALPQHPQQLPRARRRCAAALHRRPAGERASTPRGREREAAAPDVDAAPRATSCWRRATAYWSLVTARESERVLREAARRLRGAPQGRAEPRATSGIAARNEVLAVQVERDRAELARLRAENAADVAEANLPRLLGLPAGHARSSRPSRSTARGAGAPERRRAPWSTAALEARPERAALRGAHRGRRGARASVEQRARAGPRPASRPATTTPTPTARILPPDATRGEDTWDVGVNRLLDALRRRPRRAAAARRPRRAPRRCEQQLEDLDRRMRLEVTAARARPRARRGARVAVAARSLEAARENLRVAGDRYREGVIPSSELLDAEMALLRAGLDQHRGAGPACGSPRAALDRAVGTLSAWPTAVEIRRPRASASAPSPRSTASRFDVERGRGLRLPGQPTAPASRPTIRMLCGLLAPTSGTRARARHRRGQGPRGGEAPHRLHEPALQPLRRPDRAAEPALLRRRLRPARPRRCAEREAWAVEMAGLAGKEDLLDALAARRLEAAAGPGLRRAAPAARRLPGRAHERRRSALAPPLLGADRRACRPRA